MTATASSGAPPGVESANDRALPVAVRQGAEDQVQGTADADGRAYAQTLIDAGVPVVICTPHEHHSRCAYVCTVELDPPKGWNSITAKECDLRRFRPGVDTLAMVGGHGVDVVDVDTKANGSIEHLPPFEFFGEHRTPSGGGHYFVRSTGFGKLTPFDHNGRHVGDYIGGTATGARRLLAYLPGSTRPKYPGAGYSVVTPIDLGKLLESEPDDDLISVLMSAGASLTGKSGKAPATRADVAALLSAHPAGTARCPYGRKAIASELAAAPLDDGRRKWILKTFPRVVELLLGGCADAGDVDAARDRLDEIKPGHGFDVDGILAWAVSNTSAKWGCRQHDGMLAELIAPTNPNAPQANPAAEPDDEHEVEHEVESHPEPLPPLRIVKASEVEPERLRYLWESRIPIGAVSLLPGPEGAGKSTVLARVGADATRGILPGDLYGKPTAVMVLAVEDHLSAVVVPRLRAAGADLDRVHIVKAAILSDKVEVDVILPRHLDRIGQAVRDLGIGLVWIDSLVTTFDDDVRTTQYKDTAKVLRALGDFAVEYNVAVVAPWHLNKTAGSDTAVRMMDSRGFRTAVRSVLMVAVDPEDSRRGIIALDKSNGGTLDIPAIRYRISASPYTVTEVDDDGVMTEVAATVGVVTWDGQVQGDGREMLREWMSPVLERENDPKKWLRDYLRDAGEVESKVVKAAGRDAGYSDSAIHRASRAVGVVVRIAGEAVTSADGRSRPVRRTLWSILQSRHSVTSPDLIDMTGTTDATGGDIEDTIDRYADEDSQSRQSCQSYPHDNLTRLSDATVPETHGCAGDNCRSLACTTGASA